MQKTNNMNESFLSFCENLNGYRIYSKETGKEVFKFQLFWAGYNYPYIVKKYILKQRKFTDRQ